MEIHLTKSRACEIKIFQRIPLIQRGVALLYLRRNSYNVHLEKVNFDLTTHYCYLFAWIAEEIGLQTNESKQKFILGSMHKFYVLSQNSWSLGNILIVCVLSFSLETGMCSIQTTLLCLLSLFNLKVQKMKSKTENFICHSFTINFP